MIGNDIRSSTGTLDLQTCSGHHSGFKLLFMHALKAISEDNNTHAAFLVDTTNAFNLVNRQVALHMYNIYTVSILFYYLKNTYSVPI